MKIKGVISYALFAVSWMTATIVEAETLLVANKFSNTAQAMETTPKDPDLVNQL